MRPLPFFVLLVSSSVSVCAVAEQTEYATVVAERAADVRSKTVDYSDLNLQHHQGVVTLYQRIRNAADFVCYDADRRSIQAELSVRRCTSEATTRAVTHVGLPELATLHAQHTGKATATMVAHESR